MSRKKGMNKMKGLQDTQDNSLNRMEGFKDTQYKSPNNMKRLQDTQDNNPKIPKSVNSVQDNGRPGYKHTPLGWIPEEWSIKEFGKFASVSKTKYVPSESENRKCIELEHINQEAGSINGYVSSANQKSTKNAFKKGQVLFGKLRPYLKKYWLADFDGVCSSEVWVLQANSQDCCNEYLFRIVQQHRFIQVANVSSGSKMPRADWDFVAEFPFALPTSPERKIIATILSTWDEAITKTQQLIAQLQQRNKGLMQQLLTGKKRLKGFEGEWKKVELRDVCEIKKGEQLNKETLHKTIGYPVINGGIEPSGYTDNWNSESNKITISEGGNSCGFVNFITAPFWAGGHCYTLNNLSSSVNLHYLFHLLKYLQRQIMKLRVGSGLPNIQQKDLCALVIQIPSYQEQRSIESILDSAVHEVQLYETKLAALQQQKKGLMQKLLTGEVRVKLSEQD